jgi:predicted nucleotidyltransferase
MSQMRCPAASGQMNAGLIASEIGAAIRSITSVESKLEAVYGFGSCFRGEPFNDIDLLAVANAANAHTLETYYELSSLLNLRFALWICPFDLTLLTSDEFKSRPLRNMGELYCLWRGVA